MKSLFALSFDAFKDPSAYTTGFCHFQEERKHLLRGDKFLQQPKMSKVSWVCKEKIAVAMREPLDTLSWTNTHTHNYHTLSTSLQQ